MGGYYAYQNGYYAGMLTPPPEEELEEEPAPAPAPDPYAAGPASGGYGEAPPPVYYEPREAGPASGGYSQSAPAPLPREAPPPQRYEPYVPMGDAANAASIPPPDSDANTMANWYYGGYDAGEKAAMAVDTYAPPSHDYQSPTGGRVGYGSGAPTPLPAPEPRPLPSQTAVPNLDAFRRGIAQPGQSRVAAEAAGLIPPSSRGVETMGDVGARAALDRWQPATPTGGRNVEAARIAAEDEARRRQAQAYSTPIDAEAIGRASGRAYAGMNAQQAERRAVEDELAVINAPRAPMGFGGPPGLPSPAEWMARTPEPLGGAYPNPLAEPGQPGSETPRGRYLGYPEPQGDTIDQALGAALNAGAMGVAGFVGPKAQAVGDAIAANPALREAAGRLQGASILPPGGMMLTGPVGARLTDEAGKPAAAPTFGEVGGGLMDFLGGPGSFTDKVGQVFQKGMEGVAQYDRPRGWNVETLGEMAIADIEGRNAMDVARARSPLLAGLYGQYYKEDSFANWARNNPNAASQAFYQGYTDPKTGQHFEGGRAMWELFVSDKSAFERAVLDVTHDPFTVLAAGRNATGVLKGVGRATGNPLARAVTAGIHAPVVAADIAASGPFALMEAAPFIFKPTTRQAGETATNNLAQAGMEVGAARRATVATPAAAPVAGEATDLPDPDNIGDAFGVAAQSTDIPPPPGGSVADALPAEAAPGKPWTPVKPSVRTGNAAAEVLLGPNGEPKVIGQGKLWYVTRDNGGVVEQAGPFLTKKLAQAAIASPVTAVPTPATVAGDVEAEQVAIPPPPGIVESRPGRLPSDPEQRLDPAMSPTPASTWPDSTAWRPPESTWPERGVPGGGEWTEPAATRRGESLIPPELRGPEAPFVADPRQPREEPWVPREEFDPETGLRAVPTPPPVEGGVAPTPARPAAERPMPRPAPQRRQGAGESPWNRTDAGFVDRPWGAVDTPERRISRAGQPIDEPVPAPVAESFVRRDVAPHTRTSGASTRPSPSAPAQTYPSPTPRYPDDEPPPPLPPRDDEPPPLAPASTGAATGARGTSVRPSPDPPTQTYPSPTPDYDAPPAPRPAPEPAPPPSVPPMSGQDVPELGTEHIGVSKNGAWYTTYDKTTGQRVGERYRDPDMARQSAQNEESFWSPSPGRLVGSNADALVYETGPGQYTIRNKATGEEAAFEGDLNGAMDAATRVRDEVSRRRAEAAAARPADAASSDLPEEPPARVTPEEVRREATAKGKKLTSAQSRREAAKRNAAAAPDIPRTNPDGGRWLVGPPDKQHQVPEALLEDASNKMLSDPQKNTAEVYASARARGFRGAIYEDARREAAAAKWAANRGSPPPPEKPWTMKKEPASPLPFPPAVPSKGEEAMFDVETRQHERFLQTVTVAYEQNPALFEGPNGNDGIFAGRYPDGHKGTPIRPDVQQEIRRRAGGAAPQRGPAPEAPVSRVAPAEESQTLSGEVVRPDLDAAPSVDPLPTGRTGSVPGEEGGVVPASQRGGNATRAGHPYRLDENDNYLVGADGELRVTNSGGIFSVRDAATNRIIFTERSLAGAMEAADQELAYRTRNRASAPAEEAAAAPASVALAARTVPGMAAVDPNAVVTDPANFQPRSQRYNREGLTQESVDDIVANFDPNRFDPPVLWRRPTDNALVVISGHHRHEAAKRLAAAGKMDLMPARVIEGTLEEAKRVARQSNSITALRPTEYGNALRAEMDEGATLDQAIKTHKIKPATNGQRYIDTTYLPPNLQEVVDNGQLDLGRGSRLGRAIREGVMAPAEAQVFYQQRMVQGDLSAAQLDHMLTELGKLKNTTRASMGDLFGGMDLSAGSTGGAFLDQLEVLGKHLTNVDDIRKALIRARNLLEKSSKAADQELIGQLNNRLGEATAEVDLLRRQLGQGPTKQSLRVGPVSWRPDVDVDGLIAAPARIGRELRAQAARTGKAVGDYYDLMTPAQRADVEVWAAGLRRELDDLGLKDVDLIVEATLKAVDPKMGRTAGLYSEFGSPQEGVVQRVISLAVNSPQGMGQTLSHEAIHALRHMGLIADDEWVAVLDDLGRIVNKKTGRSYLDSVPDEYRTTHYVGRADADEQIAQEAVAEAYVAWKADPSAFAPATRNVFQKIADFFGTIYRRATGNPPATRSAQDVFQRISSGEVGTRPRQTTGGPAPGPSPRLASAIGDFANRTDPASELLGTQDRPGKIAALGRAFGFKQGAGRMALPAEAGAWSQRFGVPLGPDKEKLFSTKYGERFPNRVPVNVRGKQWGEVWDKAWTELESAKRIASVDPIARDAGQQQLLKRVAARHGLDEQIANARAAGAESTGDDVADLLRDLPDEAIDRMAANAANRPLMQEYGVHTRPEYGIPGLGRVIRATDAYNSFTRENVLTGNATVARYVLQQYLGNPITGSIGGMAKSSLRAMSPVEVARAYKTMKSGVLQEDSPYLKQLNRWGKAPDARVMQAGQRDFLGAQAPGDLARPGKLWNTWGRLIRQPEGRLLANAIDFLHREVASAAGMLRAQRPLESALRAHVGKRAVEMQAKVVPANAEAAIKALTDDPDAVVGAVQVRKALEALNPSDAATKKWADRMARDWEQATSEAQKLAEKDAFRVFFSGEETRVDAALSRVISFHYWASRAGRLYATQGLKNPAIMSAYARALEWQEKEADPRLKPFVAMLKDTPAGWTTFMNPVALLASFLTFTEEGERNDEGITDFGRFVRDIPAMIAPALSAALFFSGKQGEEYAPNVGGLNNDAMGYAAVLRQMGASGLIGENTTARELAKLGNPTDWMAEKLSGARQMLFAHGYWGKPPDIPVPGSSRRDELNDLIAEEIRKDKPTGAELKAFADTLPDGTPPHTVIELFYERRMIDAIDNEESPYWQAANKRQAEKEAIGALQRFVNPLYHKTKLNSRADMAPLLAAARVAIDDDDTAAESFSQFLADVTTERDPRSRELLYDREVREAIYDDPVARPLYEEWQMIADGTLTGTVSLMGSDGNIYTYGKDQLAGMDYQERKALADAWAKQNGNLQLIHDYKYNVDMFDYEAPELAQATELKHIAAAYDKTHGGTGSWIEDTRAANPAYDEWLTESGYDETMATGSAKDKEIATATALGWRGHAVIRGWEGGVYDTPLEAETNAKVAGGTTYDAAYQAHRKAQVAEGAERISEDLALWEELGSPMPAPGTGKFTPAQVDEFQIAAANALGLPIRQKKDGNWYIHDGSGKPDPVASDLAYEWWKERAYLGSGTKGYQASGYSDPSAWMLSPAYEEYQRTADAWYDPATFSGFD